MNVAFAAVDVPALALAQMSPHWCSCTRVEPAQSPSITFRHKEPPPPLCVCADSQRSEISLSPWRQGWEVE